MIDLHAHSNISDGSDPPARIPELAAAAGCKAVALTDHDRLDGVPEAAARAEELGVQLVAGCELSCGFAKLSMHMLAYFLEPGPGPLQDELVSLQEARHQRNVELAGRMAELGLPCTLEEMEAESGGIGTGRPHAAAVLVRNGVVGSVREAFDEWLGTGRPAYVASRRLDASDGLRLARASGAVVVLAHPFSLGLEEAELESVVGELASLGLAGLESLYGRYTPEERTALSELAGRHDLVATGGSDYHGTYKPDLQVGVGQGDLEVPDEVLDELAARRPAVTSR